MIDSRKVIHFSVLLLLVVVGVLFFRNDSDKNQFAQPVNAQANAATPTYACLGSCPTPEPSGDPGLSPALTGEPTVTEPDPSSIEPTDVPPIEPTEDPCVGTNMSNGKSGENASVQHHKHRQKGGGGFFEAFFEFLFRLILLLLGGNVAPLPTDPGLDPCTPTVAPTTVPAPVEPTDVAPTTGNPGTTTTPITPATSILPSWVAPTTIPDGERIAVVYSDDSTGAADGDDTGAAVTMLQQNTKWAFKIITAGPNGTMTVQQALAQPNVVLYVQPGASGDDVSAYERQQGDTAAIQNFVRNGGRYLGICMGQFLAGPEYFKLFPGQTNEYYSSAGADVTTPDAAMISITWRGNVRQMYFQDGGYMVPDPGANIEVLATYSNGTAAAAVASYGNGKVGLVGPHPEAPPAWYETEGLTDPDGLDDDLGDDLVDTLMR